MSAIQDQPPEHRARAPKGPDPKWRYMWRIGKRPAETQFQELNAEPVVPAGDSLSACTCLILENCHRLSCHTSNVTDQSQGSQQYLVEFWHAVKFLHAVATQHPYMSHGSAMLVNVRTQGMVRVCICLNCPILITGFPEWPEVMTAWGNKMLEAVHTVAEMAAVGFDLPSCAFTERMAFGPHLLAPTGVQLTVRRFCKKEI